MNEEIKRWMKQSNDDFDTAKYNFAGKKYSVAVFYCQQSVEKALKSLILDKKKQLIKVHDLVKLGKEINLPQNLLNYCKEITQSYIYSRYPDIKEPKNMNVIASNFLKYTEEILKWVKKQL